MEQWEQPEVVAEFAARSPDVRLAALLDAPEGARIRRALDIGCAGGRNTVLLAQRGIDVHAVDASSAMVAETRRRLKSVLEDAAARVLRLRMDELQHYADDSFDLVLSLGVWHSAADRAEWERSVAEAVRVLAPGGLLMVSQFTPGTELPGATMLMTAAELERELRARGLDAIGEVQTLGGGAPGQRRSSATGTFRKR